MATYLQGVTDYIPDYQPFQPDLNFYNNYLQTKQTQYDTNWKSLNNLYGQYFYADLTRDKNIEKKDDLLKQIDFNLNRVAGLDLSLEQNVNQAAQIFTPFYEDKFLMKDMAYTKNFMSEYNKANGLKASKDEKQRSQYWDTGVKKMLYERDEFKSSTDEESLAFGNVSYTPYVNAIEKYMKNAKDLGMSADITQSNGRYFIRQKNGDLIYQPLTNLFTSQFANDPALQEVYKAQAYVNRKDHIMQNKDKFNGDLQAAERDYLTNQYATIQEYIKLKNSKNIQDKDNLEKQADEINKKLADGDSNEFTPGYAKSLEVSLGIAKDNANYSESLSEQVNDKASKTTATSGSAPEMGDLERLRFQVDAGVASMLAEQDINEAAYIYSRKDMVVDMAADPYGVSAQNHAYALQRQREAQTHSEQLLFAKDLQDKKKLMLDAGLKNGSYIGMKEVKDEAGNIIDYEPIPNPSLNNRFNIPGKNASGGTTNKSMSVIQEGKNLTEDFTSEYADGMVRMITSTIDSWIKDHRMTKEEASNYFFSDSGKVVQPKTAMDVLDNAILFAPKGAYKGASYQGTMQRIKDNRLVMSSSQFLAEYKKDPAKFLTGRGSDQLSKTYARVLQFAQATRGDKGISDNFLMTAPHDKFNTYIDYVRNNEIVTQKNNETLQKNFRSSTLMKSLPKYGRDKLADLALNSDLTLVSKKEFVQMASQYVGARKLSNEVGGDNWFRAEMSLTKNETAELNTLIKSKVSPEVYAQYINQTRNAVGAPKYDYEWTPQVNRIKKQYLTPKFMLDENGDVNSKEVLSTIYDDISKIYKTTIQNPKEMKSASFLISKNKANAVYNTTINGVGVNMSAIQSNGFKGFLEFTKDVSNINFYDMKNNPISFYGPNISGVNKTKELYEDEDDIHRHIKIAELIISEYQNNIGNEEFKTFNLGSAQVAVEDRNKGAMVIYPTLDVLKKLKEGDGKGLLDETLINDIATNGISLISNRKNWNNWVFKGNEMDPTESMVNALGSIHYENPMGGGKFTIEKDPSGVAPYKVYGEFFQLTPDGRKVKVPFVVPPVNFQNNVSLANQLVKSYLQEQVSANMEIWQKFHANSYRPGVSKITPESQEYLRNQ